MWHVSSMWNHAVAASYKPCPPWIPPSAPGKVQDVRVFVYSPLRDPMAEVTALVVWEGLTPEEAGGVVEIYTVVITDSQGMELVVCMSPEGSENNLFII